MYWSLGLKWYFYLPPFMGMSIRVKWSFKSTMLGVVLDLQKIYKTILEKAFFFILCHSVFFWFLCKRILKMPVLRGDFFFFEIGYLVYLKNRECWSGRHKYSLSVFRKFSALFFFITFFFCLHMDEAILYTKLPKT